MKSKLMGFSFLVTQNSVSLATQKNKVLKNNTPNLNRFKPPPLSPPINFILV